MEKIFIKTDHNVYTLDYEEVSILVKVKPEAIIVLEMPKNQYNLNNTSCIWFYRQVVDDFPTRCITALNLYDQYHM